MTIPITPPPRDTSRSQEYLGLGIGKSFDAAITWERVPGGGQPSFDFSFSYVDPVVNYTPGVSVGVVDALDRSTDGRRFFFAVTYRSGLDGRHNSRTPAEATIGAFVGASDAMFVGVSLPFSESFRLVAEHDSFRIGAGFEVRPVRDFSVRWIQRDGQNQWSLSLLGRL